MEMALPSGEPLIVRLTFTNISKAPLFFAKPGPPFPVQPQDGKRSIAIGISKPPHYHESAMGSPVCVAGLVSGDRLWC